MASRPIVPPRPVIAAGDMSGDLISEVTIVQNVSMVSYDIAFSGTPTGTFSVEVSNTYAQNSDGTVRTAGTWTALTLSSPTAASGSAGTGFIDVDQIASYAIRLKYTAVSGTGTLNATINCKVA